MSVATHGAQGAAVPVPQRKGVTSPSDRGGRSTFVSDVIVELGFVDRAVVEEAVQEARRSGKGVPRILLSAGALSEDQLARATAERYGLDHVDLAEFEVDVAATNLISRASASRYAALPIAFDESGALVVAMADPADPLATGDITVMTKLEVKPVVATTEGIEALLKRLPEIDQPGGSRAAGDGGRESGAPGAGHVNGAVVWQAEGVEEVSGQADQAHAAPAEDVPADPSPRDSELEEEVRALKEQLETEREAHAATCDRLKAEVDEMQAKMVDLLEKLERASRLEGEVASATAGVGDAERRARTAASRVSELEGALAQTRVARDEANVRHERELEAVRAAAEAAAREHGEAGARTKAELDALLVRTEAAERNAEAAAEAEAKAEAKAKETKARAKEAEARIFEVEAAAKDADGRASAADAAAGEAEGRAADAEAKIEDAARRISEIEATAKGAKRSAKEAEARLDDAEAIAKQAEERAEAAEQSAQAAEQEARATAARASELEAADERAERSRTALAEMREEGEREQELHARRVQDLEQALNAERARGAALAESVTAVAGLRELVGGAVEELASVRDALGRVDAAAANEPPAAEPPAES